MDSPLECLGLRQTMGFAISRESELGFGAQASRNGHMHPVIHLRNTTAGGSTPQACARCVQELPYRCDHQIVVSAATPRNFVSWLTSGTSNESAVAATRRSAGSPGKGSPRPPARSATTSVTG